MMYIRRAVETLLYGGVIAYPTEGVYGLGCLPDDTAALLRLLAVKKRDISKGLIMITDSAERFDTWIALPEGRSLPPPDPQHPVTWIVPPGPRVGLLVLGDHENLAVRITGNPVAAAICKAVGSPIVSTSANLSGKRTARNRWVLRRQFSARVDYIVPGDCGPATGPSEIRELISGRVLRPR
jgi:L-threonylcarbamoyladenylate synthase